MYSDNRQSKHLMSVADFSSELVPSSNSFSPHIHPASSITVIILSWQVKKLKNKFKYFAQGDTINNRAVCVIAM